MREADAVKRAVLYAQISPDEKQREGFLTFLWNRYHCKYELQWVESQHYENGFRLETDDHIFEWHLDMHKQQLIQTLSQEKDVPSDPVESIRSKVDSFKPALVGLKPRKAMLYASEKPTPEQMRQFQNFMFRKYGRDVILEWKESHEFEDGFRIRIGDEVIDWNQEHRLKQFRAHLAALKEASENVIPLLKESIHNWVPEASVEESGWVLSVGDGIAYVSGIRHAAYGEIVLFESGVRGMVLNLTPNGAGCILFGSDDDVVQGSKVYRTLRTAGVPVGEAFLGRVVNALGEAIDGGDPIEAEGYREIEHPAPGIIDRQPVNRPLETGLLTIDAMFPIGRGQRELIIGDRQTGKTSIAVDTILNQKGRNVVCIYVAIGQKVSSVAQLTENLRRHGAMDYTIIVNASASESAPMQYIAPYAGCSLGEYFMEQGRDVLIVYDDLTKHAIAYRALSLLLDRSPGREAYPGDVFYLHSRLLERSAHLSDELGGGSMTALPIVETQAGDVSAYIPTNIISITDGQIFLESKLFFEGQRPAVNVGLSVSRVGGDAQTKAMKKSAGSIRLDLAQYREMEVFTQFSSDLDDVTRDQLHYGQGLMQLLRQPQNHPKKQYQQVIMLTAALNHTMQKLSPKSVHAYIEELLSLMEREHAELCERLERTGVLSDEDKSVILETARTLAAQRG